MDSRRLLMRSMSSLALDGVPMTPCCAKGASMRGDKCAEPSRDYVSLVLDIISRQEHVGVTSLSLVQLPLLQLDNTAAAPEASFCATQEEPEADVRNIS